MSAANGKSTIVPTRLPNDMIRSLDARVAEMRGKLPGVNYTRADAIRQLLSEGLSREGAKRK